MASSQQAPPQQGPRPMPQMGPRQPPTPEQIAQMQQRLNEDAAKAGLTVPEFVAKLKQAQQAQQLKQQAMMRQAAQGGGQPGQPGQPQRPQQPTQQGQPQPVQPGPPKPEALALANFLKKQNLKPRTCILNGQRKDMFKVKRALRALQSDEYEKARKKNKLLPEITDRASLENCFKLLPLSLLALRVSKIDEHAGHDHAKKKRVKGLWTVKIEQQQECREELHYVWLYEGSQIKQKLTAAGLLALVFAVVMFPLWPVKLRIAVWYLSMGMLGLIGLFFAMAIVRLILFCITYVVASPGLWLFPNLFEDVGFFDSFKPVWGWQEVKKSKKKSSKSSKSSKKTVGNHSSIPMTMGMPVQPPATATTTSAEHQMATPVAPTQHMAPKVEEVFDEE